MRALQRITLLLALAGWAVVSCKHHPSAQEQRATLDTQREVLKDELSKRRYNETLIDSVVDNIHPDSLASLFATDSALARELRNEVERGAPVGRKSDPAR